jgi:YD repeat-containing protein
MFKLSRLASIMFLQIFVQLVCFSSHALIDMKDANFVETWNDIDLGGPGYVLKVERTYNSRSIYDGIFGFGWCSDFETRLEITPDSKIKVIECGGGLEVLYTTKEAGSLTQEALVAKIVLKVKQDKKDSGLKEQYFKNLESELNTNEFLREALANELGFKGSITKGKTYYTTGRGSERLIVNEDSYKRVLADGTYQLFDTKGRIVALYDNSKNFIKLNYVNDKLVSVMDNKSRRLDFAYNQSNSKVSKIVATPANITMNYAYKAHDLSLTTSSKGFVHEYKYDDLHNMTEAVYPDKTKKKFVYNQDKDWVVSFVDQQGCQEQYNYKDSEDDPRNHYWSEVKKTCNGKVTNESKYEFWHKENTDKSGKYLARVKSEVNGLITDVKYHPEFGRPIFKQDGKEVAYYDYYSNGLLRTRKNSDERLKYFYKNSCNKVSKIVQENLLKRKVASTFTTNYLYYMPSCNLKLAANTKGESAQLSYDSKGRIYMVADHTKKILKINYDNLTGKPNILTRPGLGAIAVKYNEQGEISSVMSKQGTAVATQVANVFNNILKVIGPAANDINI